MWQTCVSAELQRGPIGHSRYLQFAMLLLYYIDHKDVLVL